MYAKCNQSPSFNYTNKTTKCQRPCKSNNKPTKSVTKINNKRLLIQANPCGFLYFICVDARRFATQGNHFFRGVFNNSKSIF